MSIPTRSHRDATNDVALSQRIRGRISRFLDSRAARKHVLASLTAIALLTPGVANADDGVNVPNAGEVKWVFDSGKAYLRNLEQFGGTGWLGCCYNYYIDLTTDNGRTMYSAFLTSYASRLPLSVYVANKANGGPVTFIGRP